jgi:uncharacterized protein YuzE
MRTHYAKRADVLYIVLEDTKNPCAYMELESGTICRVDETTKRVVGITIPDFSRIASAGEGVSIPGLQGSLAVDRLILETQGKF